MKTTINIFFLLAIILHGQSALENVRSLELSSLENDIETYYSNGCEKEAENIVNLLGNAVTFFKDEFGIDQDFSIAILHSDDWLKISKLPYGLPFVSGPPYVICFPGDAENELGKIIIDAVSKTELEEKYSLSNQDIAEEFITLIGFHELGHIYSKEYGINFPNKWTFEFAATYLAYLYLSEHAPNKNEIWLDAAAALLKNIKPQHTSLQDFENLYVRVGVENYAWYQVVFLIRAAETAEKRNSTFVNKLKSTELKNSSDYSLSQFENISPGFINWAKKYGLF